MMGSVPDPSVHRGCQWGGTHRAAPKMHHRSDAATVGCHGSAATMREPHDLEKQTYPPSKDNWRRIPTGPGATDTADIRTPNWSPVAFPSAYLPEKPPAPRAPWHSYNVHGDLFPIPDELPSASTPARAAALGLSEQAQRGIETAPVYERQQMIAKARKAECENWTQAHQTRGGPVIDLLHNRGFEQDMIAAQKGQPVSGRYDASKYEASTGKYADTFLPYTVPVYSGPNPPATSNALALV